MPREDWDLFERNCKLFSERLPRRHKLFREIVIAQYFWHPQTKEVRLIEVNPRQALVDENIFDQVFETSQVRLSIDLQISGYLSPESGVDFKI